MRIYEQAAPLKDFLQLEHSAFSAWPALEQYQFLGIIVRSSQGYTKRANSANVLAIAPHEYLKVLAHVEEYFKRCSLASIFRLPLFESQLSHQQVLDFDDHLQHKGYAYQDKSLVYQKQLKVPLQLADYQTITAHYTLLNLEQWLAAFCQFKYGQQVDKNRHVEPHLAILKRIKTRVIPAVLLVDNQIVCCALGVVDGDVIGLFDVITKPDQRGKGYAQQLITRMLNDASAEHIKKSYLQVVADNTAALGLYEKLGFTLSYQYWYRVKEI